MTLNLSGLRISLSQMGLFLRYNLFRDTTAAAVYGSYAAFYHERGRPLLSEGHDFRRIDFHCECNGWVVVNLDAGWEWKERREAQLFVSRRIWCAGFLIYVYDGEYWGYEFFDKGVVLDHFVQEGAEAVIGFPGEECAGNAYIVAERLPSVRPEDIASYLVQKRDWVVPEGADVPARPGDEFRRFDECAVLDFLRMLGVAVGLRDGHVRVDSPILRSAFISTGPQSI